MQIATLYIYIIDAGNLMPIGMNVSGTVTEEKVPNDELSNHIYIYFHTLLRNY